MIPGFEVVQGKDAGSFKGGGHKICLHTTEGSSAAGAIGAYRANNSWPHFTFDYPNRRYIQHLELNVAARSLYNDMTDGFEVGRANVIQIEEVGFSRNSPFRSNDELAFTAEGLRRIREHFDFPLQYPVFSGTRVAFSDKAWVDYSGIVGHQHAPDNKSGHWDPGALNVGAIVGILNGSPVPVTPPAQPAPAPTGGLLRRGMVGIDVVNLQNKLNVHGYSLKADGVFGLKTESAVKDFQAKNGLGVDGVVGPATRGALDRVFAPKPVYPGRLIQQGEKNSAINKQIQTALNTKGARLKVDGDFGKLTKQAVINFQRVAGLAQDGIVGPATWAKLF